MPSGRSQILAAIEALLRANLTGVNVFRNLGRPLMDEASKTELPAVVLKDGGWSENEELSQVHNKGWDMFPIIEITVADSDYAKLGDALDVLAFEVSTLFDSGDQNLAGIAQHTECVAVENVDVEGDEGHRPMMTCQLIVQVTFSHPRNDPNSPASV